MTTSTHPTASPPLTDGLQPGMQPPTIAELTHNLLEQLSTLFRQELHLATVQLSQSLTVLLVGATSVVIAGALLFAGLLVLLCAAVLGLSFVMPAWGAAVLVGSVVMLLGILALSLGISRFRAATAGPWLSAESLRKDKDVLTRREHH